MEHNYVEAFVEIPKGSSNKYEYDQERKVLVLDRPLFSPMFYPADYGFVPDTLADDGDPLDIMVLMANPTFPGCLIGCRVIGMFLMSDEKGHDEKIIAVPVSDPRYAEIQEVDDMGPHLKLEFEHFFSQYKQLEGKKVTVEGWAGRKQALEALARAKANYLKANK